MVGDVRQSIDREAQGASTVPPTDPFSGDLGPPPHKQSPRTRAAAKPEGRLSVVVIGHVCIDRNDVDGVTHVAPGSPAYFIALALRGHPTVGVTAIAPHGADFDEVAPWLSFATPTVGDATMRFQNIVRGEVRTQLATELALAAPQPLTRQERRALHAADIVLIAPLVDELPSRYVADAIDATNPHALIVLIPQGYLRHVDESGVVSEHLSADLEDVAQECSLIVFSDDDIDDAEYAAWRLAELENRPRVVITKAGRGATIVTDTDSIDVPTTAIATAEISNPVGPGDVFASACAIAVRRGMGIEDAVRAGHAAASRHLRAPSTDR